ncbi:MAG: hypothetical protein A2664_03330 [Candidatus Taylorbacteria bacterium RIFCSPHIGHO2_01_FULL_46_22b]|uniref:Transglycosylase SLT domain-containing protein n=1 Tax=Candidatus Taylorbacteria bacterium RIFCSPHIGHO2_01_FULL_46_22b TaxID=1802301 RepID=A0A1G2M187_9BACT|nr:MAG: hypothetical protein A2664_03330 [Candidatus Taylorbacteria bacterium RIFCSPHIGHO2_01_FULL_46_22b]
MIVEITSSLMLLLSSGMLGQGTTSSQSTVPNTISSPKMVIETIIDTRNQKDVAAYVKEYFADAPIMMEIARCESTYRQSTLQGSVIRGRVNPADVGVMQINEYYHADTAEKLGIDLHTLEGNLAYAKYLYEKEGVRPWKSSQKCWSPALERKG